MKRILSLILALFCLLSLTGCRTRAERRIMRQQLEYADGVAQPDLPDPMETEDGTTLEAQTIYSSGGVTVTALGIYESDDYYYIPFSLRNDSGNRVSWYFDSAFTVNGWETYGFADSANDVISGGLEYDTLRLGKDALTQVVRPGQISGTLTLDSSDWADVSFTLTTSAGEGENKPLAFQETVWSDDSLSLYLTDVKNTYSSLTFCFYGESYDRYGCYVDIEQTSVNGKGEDELFPWCSVSIPEGGKRFFELILDWDELEDAGISRSEALETLDFALELSGGASGSAHEIPVQIDLTQLNG